MNAFSTGDERKIRKARELVAAGQPARARTLLEQVVRANPGEPSALADYCSVLLALGDVTRAADLLAQAWQRFGSARYLAHMLAECLLAMARPGDALAVCDDDLRRNGSSVETLFLRALAMQGAGHPTDAVIAYRGLLGYAEQLPQVLVNLGNACCALGAFDEAIDCYTGLLKRFPMDIEVRLALVSALVENGDLPAAALELAHPTLEAIQDDRRIAVLRATIQQIAGLEDDALKTYAEVLGVPSVEALSDPGLCSDYRFRALCASEKLHGVVVNAAMILRAQGMHAQARDMANAVLNVFPGHPNAHELLGGITLRYGDYASGWRHWRYRRIGFVPDREYPSQAWPVERYVGSIVLKREQGLGDDILFSRVIPILAGRCELTVVAGERLIELFRAWWPDHRYLTESAYEAVRGELGVERLMGDALADLYPEGPAGEWCYPRRVGGPAMVSRRLRVGLSWWSGGKEGPRKSIPIEAFAAFIGSLAVDFVNLQYGKEGDRFGEFFHGTDLLGAKREASSLLADADRIASCDVVVTCSNTCAHLSGALGIPTLALVPRNRGRFWYWHAGEASCPWYPSVQLLEQTEDGCWDGPLLRALEWLHAFIDAPTTSPGDMTP